MNLLLFFYLLAIAPKLFLDRVLRGKRHPNFLQRLGFHLPIFTTPTIWIHAVSVGEVKAAAPLLLELRKKDPTTPIILSTTTATGQQEAKKLHADALFYLPLDFTFVVRSAVKKLNPKLFLFIESDFWPNLLKALRAKQTRIALVSGKMSARSARRFRFFSPFSKYLFSHFDSVLLQDASYLPRFQPFVPPSRLHIAGNLKLDLAPQIPSPLNIPTPAITISCTHPTEEEALLNILLPSPYFLILAPRHPERFKEVASLLAQKNIPFSRWNDSTHPHQLLLVDQMGHLPTCYTHSRLAILAGSYNPHIGGHNPLEPALYHTPVFFGPHTHGQKELTHLILAANAGKQLLLPQLRAAIDAFFANPQEEKTMRQAAAKLIEEKRGTARRTVEILLAGDSVPQKPLAKD